MSTYSVPDILVSAKTILPLNHQSWAIQRPRAQWYHLKHSLTDEWLAGMLRGEYWLACRPPNALTDRIVVDIDGIGHGVDCIDRDRRYRALREVLGSDRVPMVYGTPGGGLHVVYRIPSTPLETLVTRQGTGLLPDALRGAGMEVQPGAVECFPREGRVLRLPLGRAMPMLDAATLTAIEGGSLGEACHLATLERAVEHMQAWYASPIRDLVEHLGALTVRAPVVQGPRVSAKPTLTPTNSEDSGDSVPIADDVNRLIRTGLLHPGTRHAAEWQVGVAGIRQPALLADLGLPRRPNDYEVGMALSAWVATRNNGHSREWADHRRRFGTETTAISAWASGRYLRPDQRGETSVERMRRAAHATGAPRVPSPREMDAIQRTGERLRSPRIRYQFEVWGTEAFRAIRQVLTWNHYDQSATFVDLQLAAKWMESWPYGSGTVDGERAYLAFRYLLASSGLLVPIAPHRHHPLNPFPGEATTYRTHVPDSHDGGHLRLPIREYRERIDGLTVHGRPVTIAEALHAVHVAGQGLDLFRAYGARTGKRVQGLIRRLVPSMAFV